MLDSVIIVWRESLEAILVVSVLLSWASCQPNPTRLRLAVWRGVGGGVLLAAGLAGATFLAQSQFAGDALEGFRLSMLLVAATLIVQMAHWMCRHGSKAKQRLEERMEQAAGGLGIGVIAALAVAREGAETFVFLFGLAVESGATAWFGMLAATVLGFLLAVATAWLMRQSARFIRHSTFFKISEVLLLMIAGALLANGVDRLEAMAWLPTLADPAWDVSGMLDDSTGFGRMLADFVGYRARPSAMLLMIMVAYWFGNLYAWRRTRVIGRNP